MKSLLYGLQGVLALMAPLSSAHQSLVNAGPRDEQWKQVEQAVQEGLPQTAIEKLKPIIEGALRDKAYAEWTKAVSQRIALEGEIEGNLPEERITRLTTELAQAPPETKPLLEALLALWYWQYFQENQWQFMERTEIGDTTLPEAGAPDFTTWDLKRLFQQIDRHFQNSLADAPRLQATPIKSFDGFLPAGTLPDRYRPTLYDFLAHEALDFYASGEQAGVKAEDAYVLEADSPVFGSLEDFLAWKITTTDDVSPTVRGLRLLQQVIQFHRQDTDSMALADADLRRIVFAWNQAVGEEKEERYQAALKRFADRWGDLEVSASARHRWAEQLETTGEKAAAREVAQVGARVFPDSPGGKECANLVRRIESKSIEVTVERVWNSPWPTIDVRYRNVAEIHFRAIAIDWTSRLKNGRQRPEELSQPEREGLMRLKAVKSWTSQLPPTADYRDQVSKLACPEDLPPGCYLLLASHRPDFANQDNQVSMVCFWVSKLAIVIRSAWGSHEIEGFVLDANSGEPHANAIVHAWHRDMSNDQFNEEPLRRTDENGMFRFRAFLGSSYLLLVEHNGEKLAVEQNQQAHHGMTSTEEKASTIFFTDRAIYRPGQTIQFKGICVSNDPAANKYRTLKGREVQVALHDANGEVVETRAMRTNDYGSFSGSFTAPRGRLLGEMTLQVQGKPFGRTSISVEEYKRPKFQVTLDAPAAPAKLNGPVKLAGKAVAYTGAAIDGAKVKWRVTRQVRYPEWFFGYSRGIFPMGESQEIARGTAATETDGRFEIEFVAKPDRSIPEKDDPAFHFTVTADVTDGAGETRSTDRSVAVAYTAVRVELSANDWQTVEKPVAVTLRASSHDGNPRRMEGRLVAHRLREPQRVTRDALAAAEDPRQANGELSVNPTDPQTWELGEKVFEQGVTTNAEGHFEQTLALGVGVYRVVFEGQDPFGKPVAARLTVHVVNPASNKLGINLPYVAATPRDTVEPGETYQLLWGSGYDQARAFIEVEHQGKRIKAFWTPEDRTQVVLEHAVTEEMRGGFTARVTMVRENRAYMTTHPVTVPWSNKELKVKWEHFVSKLTPDAKETWTAVITGPDARQTVAEMVATLYDASLDAFRPHDFPTQLGKFRRERSHLQSSFENRASLLQHVIYAWEVPQEPVEATYRSFPAELSVDLWGFSPRMMAGMGGLGGGGMGGRRAPVEMAFSPMMAPESSAPAGAMAAAEPTNGVAPVTDPRGPTVRKGPDLGQVAPRRKLQETAFFFPHLTSGKDGVVRMTFTAPESLTRWKFLGFAHDRDLKAGSLVGETVTAKDLMVQPNPPRFLREGDTLEFTVKVTNQSPTRQQGKVALRLSDANSGESIDSALGNRDVEQDFDIPASESRSYSWRLVVPDGLGPIAYKAIGGTDRMSDGEEGYLPVLARRVLVQESLPLAIRGVGTKKFEFTKLKDSGQSDTLRHQSLTVQMTSNPAWYAVMALPYLMEFPHECSEQTFNRLYANSLARHIANSDPRIRQVFESWRGTEALDSPLEKNEDLKSVALEETPWLRAGKSESAARRNVAILFDANRLDDETARGLAKLTEMQRADGAWPWFPGGPESEYITLYITTGFGRLRRLGVDIDVDPALRSLERLDAWLVKIHQDIVRDKRVDKNNLNPTIALFLYGRSFFLVDRPLEGPAREALDYFVKQAQTHWLSLDNRQSQAHVALALSRLSDQETAQAIVKSLKERSVTNEELGRFWRDTEKSWWWRHAPIETQALMIEVFDEVAKDAVAVEECKAWLLKQKQTQNWHTTKATADAVYALLMRGVADLASTKRVEVTAGGEVLKPTKVEAGTGFYEHRFVGAEVTARLGDVTVRKRDAGVAWGGVHWQYLEDTAKITPHEGTPLTLNKSLYVKQHTAQGAVLQPIRGPVAVGDELVVRVELRVDRDMEYVHLKDHRGSGVEPVNVLSQFKYQDGLGYYESTRDTASHFFIHYLPKGTYVFEYSTRVVHRGTYQSGMASIECMYAPEFKSHSGSVTVEAK